MTMYARAIDVTVSFGNPEETGDHFTLSVSSGVKVLPLWAAQFPGFGRLWAAGHVVVATDAAMTQIITSIPASELPGGTTAAQQAALDAKAPLASPAFTGTPTGITKAHVGLALADNTPDVSKPVSTAQAAAIATKLNTSAVIDNTDGTVSVGSVKAMGPITTVVVRSDNTAPVIGQTTYYNATSGNRTPSMPALSGLAVGARLWLRRDPADVSANTVTVSCPNPDTFYSSGTTSFTLPILGEQREFQVVSVSGTKYWAPGGSLNPLSGLDARYASEFDVRLDDNRTPIDGSVTAAKFDPTLYSSSANAFIPISASTVTAAGTTTLSNADKRVQVFTGTTTQTVLLPTTGVVAGQQYTIVNQSTGAVTVQSSGANAIVVLNANKIGVFTAVVATPTTAANWIANAPTPSTVVSTVAMRDANGNLLAVNFVVFPASTVTAAGTTTLTIASTAVQVFTGSSTQTVLLPTTGVVAGQTYTIVNQSTGVVTVQSSGANTITTLAANTVGIFAAAVSTPTTAANWLTLGVRDGNNNASANAFIPGFTTTATAGGTTTLTAASSEIQLFTGSSTQTVVLPTTGVVAGQRFTITNTSSGGSLVVNASGGGVVNAVAVNAAVTFTALQATPTTAAHWVTVIGTGTSASTAASAFTNATRDGQANLKADAFVPGFTTTVSAAGTTTLTVDSTEVQEITGSTTQTVVLPTTSIVAGQRFTITNNSSGVVTVNASGGSQVALLVANQTALCTALVATPTVPSNWSFIALSAAPISISPSAASVVRRDGNSNILSNTIIPSVTSTVTAAGITTLTITSAHTQVFTGSTTQTVKLPTTGVVAGQQYAVSNQSTGAVAVQASDASSISSVASNTVTLFVAILSTPTASTHWRAI